MFMGRYVMPRGQSDAKGHHPAGTMSAIASEQHLPSCPA